MRDQLQSIRRLLPLLDVAFHAEQARMAQINARIDELRQQLKEIETTHAPSDGEISPAIRAGADINWQTWVQERRTLINREIAAAMVKKETAKVSLKLALAKLEAARQVETRALADARQIADRRSNW